MKGYFYQVTFSFHVIHLSLEKLKLEADCVVFEVSSADARAEGNLKPCPSWHSAECQLVCLCLGHESGHESCWLDKEGMRGRGAKRSCS